MRAIFHTIFYLCFYFVFTSAFDDGYYDGFIVDDDTATKTADLRHHKSETVIKSVIAKVESNNHLRDDIQPRKYRPVLGNMALTLMPSKNLTVKSDFRNDTLAVKSFQPTTFRTDLGRGSMALSSYTPKKHEEEKTMHGGTLGTLELLSHLKSKLNLEKTLIKLANESFHASTDSKNKEVQSSKKEDNSLEGVFSKIQPNLTNKNKSSGRRNMLTNSTIKGFLSKDTNYTFKDVNKAAKPQPSQQNVKAFAANKSVQQPPLKHKLVNGTTQSHFFQKLYSKLYAKHHPGHNAAPGAAALIPVSRKAALKKRINNVTHHMGNVSQPQNVSNKSNNFIINSTSHIQRKNSTLKNSLGCIPIKNNISTEFHKTEHRKPANSTGNTSVIHHETLANKSMYLNSSENVEALANAVSEGDDTIQFLNAVKQHRIHLIDPDELESLRVSQKGVGMKRKDVIDDQTETECGSNSTCPDGKYCRDMLCYACHRKHHECIADTQCCSGMPCVYGRCDEKPKGSPGTICNADSDCGNNGCCVIEPTIDKKHGICKRKLEEFHQCSPVLFRKVWIGDEQPQCGPCVEGLECVEKGVSASHLICMKKKDDS